MPPQPRPKPIPPSRLENLGYGLGDVELLADAYPYMKNDPLARLGLSGFNRGETRRGLADLIDTDPRHLNPAVGTTLRGTYTPSTDKVYVGTTDLDVEELPYSQKYLTGLPVVVHELRHRGLMALKNMSEEEQHKLFEIYDRESLVAKYGENFYDGLPKKEQKFLQEHNIDTPDGLPVKNKWGFDMREILKLDELDGEARKELQRRGVPPQAVMKQKSITDKIMEILGLIN
tara:strand:- start:53 stop:745 length:693 start_codon:yes stop_codon:yes gene_type:complete